MSKPCLMAKIKSMEIAINLEIFKDIKNKKYKGYKIRNIIKKKGCLRCRNY